MKVFHAKMYSVRQTELINDKKVIFPKKFID